MREIRSARRLKFALCVVLFASVLPGAQAQLKPYPVTLEVLAPSYGGNRVPTVTLSGWPIVLKMSANREIGIGTQVGAGNFPVSGDQGFIVFEEPDDCHSWVDPTCPANETYFSFIPGGCVEENGSGVVPSLVLLADEVGGANLAGAFDVVGYELSDSNHRTTVIASFVVPQWFLRTVPLVDLCVGALLTPDGPCEGGAVGIDASGSLVGLGQIVNAFNQDNLTTFRAFVVSGPAPEFLEDLDGDGVIGAKDAELAGFRGISREATFEVRTLYQIEDLINAPILVDLDGNAVVTCEICRRCPVPGADCQTGGGGLTPVPR